MLQDKTHLIVERMDVSISDYSMQDLHGFIVSFISYCCNLKIESVIDIDLIDNVISVISVSPRMRIYLDVNTNVVNN